MLVHILCFPDLTVWAQAPDTPSQAHIDLQAYLAQALAGLAQPTPFSPDTPPRIGKSKQSNQRVPSTFVFEPSPLPSSSPFAARSPSSSPVRPSTLGSSPGPMGSPIKEENYNDLPYKLPPGPYSPKKPDWSYAAMIGQAVLSSQHHRLTLQEIYDWITIVYPHYKRGESTWMNSIRHVLSTTITFRKVPRERVVGRTLWAIWDEDLPCFAGGGFKKHLCKDYAASLLAKGQQPSSAGTGKTRARKRDMYEAPTEPIEGLPAQKKPKQEPEPPVPSSSALQPARAFAPVPYTQQARTIFGPTGTSSNQQTYYDVCMATASARTSAPQPISRGSGQLLPPLMASGSKHVCHEERVVESEDEDDPMDYGRQLATSTPQSAERSGLQDERLPSSSPSSPQSSLPDLTPHRRSSSSPPPSYPATSDADIDEYLIVPDDDEGDQLDESSYLTDPDSYHDIVPGSLLSSALDDDSGYSRHKHRTVSPFVHHLFAVSYELPQLSLVNDSPTPAQGRSNRRASTPPPQDTGDLPCTPPKFRGAPVRKALPSPQSTPYSHRGLYMSPSTSLVHYKSHLDPPPSMQYADDDDAADERKNENLRTPSRTRPVRSSLLHSFAPLHTPHRSSPFRTPRSRVPQSISPGPLFDPYDASGILAAEVRNSRRRGEDGESGALVKRSTLLWQSPGLGPSGERWY